MKESGKFMKKILVLHTGGTISMQADQNGAVESSPINPMTQVTSPLENIEVVSVDFFNLPSPHIQIDHMMMIYKKIRVESSHIDGFVITHVTDTL